MTFGDKIRSMNDDELANMLWDVCKYSQFSGAPMLCSEIGEQINICYSYDNILEWLKWPVDKQIERGNKE